MSNIACLLVFTTENSTITLLAAVDYFADAGPQAIPFDVLSLHSFSIENGEMGFWLTP
jgi:hypothetical protein